VRLRPTAVDMVSLSCACVLAGNQAVASIMAETPDIRRQPPAKRDVVKVIATD